MQVLNPLDVPGQAFDLELLNPNPSSRRTKDGPIYRVSFEIDHEAHQCFMNARAGNLRLLARMVVAPDDTDEAAVKALEVTEEKPAKEAKLKKERGPFGHFWRQMHIAGFASCPGVREEIERQRTVEGSDAWEVLRCIFGVNSMSFVSADEVMQRFPGEQVRVMVDQAIRKATEAQAR